MNQFVSAFERGQAAAEDAAKNRKEINEVVLAVSAALSMATGNRIEISVRDMPKPAKNALGHFLSFEVERCLTASNPIAKDSTPVRLATWEQAQEGYPCSMTFGPTQLRCYEREGLEQSMEALLSDTGVGEKLRKLLQLPIDEAAKGNRPPV